MGTPLLEKAFKSFGENKNTPTIAMCGIAIFKGIFRPLFTMMDKKSDPETKKYAAIREGLTEVAALPLYALTPFVASKIAKKVAAKIDCGAARAAKMENNAKFIGLGIATLIIPAVCNIIQPPIMKAYKKSQDAKKAKLDIQSVDNSVVNLRTQNSVNNSENMQVKQPLATPFQGANYGMKVGG